ncbi:hypothetical protein PG985_010836 [Apiospora marii]|uniref:Uncharacterized protein n=1 Tax=Apiospora marii TaxID=335849 RepID=A0ABR1T424_9PEZI
MEMHPSNPFFNRGTHESREPSPGPKSSAPSERHSTNPFRRPKRTTMPTGHEDTDDSNAELPTGHTDNDCDSPDLPTTSGPGPDPDPEIPDLTATAGTSPSTAMPDSPQESPSHHDSASTSTALGPTTPAVGRIPVDIRARRAGRRGLNLHVHWGDQDAAAPSSSTPAPPQDDDQPVEATPEQHQNLAARSPPNPPNQPPTTQSAPDPGASQPNNNMFIIQ